MPTPLPTLEQIEESPEFLNMSPERQVRVYGQWKRDVTERLKNPDDQAFIENVVNGRAQQRLESRGVVGESAKLFKEKFLGNVHNFTRGINGTIAQAARLASSELAAQSPGTNEVDTRIAQTNQNIILQVDRQMDGLREEFVKLGQDPKANRERRVEIAKSMRALEETKRKSEETLKPIIEKTKAEGFLAEVAGNQELAAQRAKNSLESLRNRFKQSEEFQNRPIVTGVVAGLAELGPMIAQAVTGPGMVTMAMDLGQRAEDQARAAVPDMTDEEAFAVRVLGGSVSMALEKIGIETAIGRIFRGSPGLSGSHIATRVSKGAIAEGLTEAAQGVAVGEIIQGVTIEEQDTIFTPEAFKERLTEAIVGGILGGGLGAIGGKRRQAEEPIPEDRPPMADKGGVQTAPTAPPLTPQEAANPAEAATPTETTQEATAEPATIKATVQARDKTRTAEVEFQSKRDRDLFAAFRNLQRQGQPGAPKLTAAEADLINEASAQGLDVQGFTNEVLDQVDASKAETVVAMPLIVQEAVPETRPKMATEETAPPLTTEEAANPTGTTAPAVSEEVIDGPVARVLSSDRKKDVAVQFRSERDKNLFAIYRKLQKQGDPNPPKITPEEIALLNQATDAGFDVQGYANSVLAGVAAAETGSQIVAPELKQRARPTRPTAAPETLPPPDPAAIDRVSELEKPAEAPPESPAPTAPVTEETAPSLTEPQEAVPSPSIFQLERQDPVTGKVLTARKLSDQMSAEGKLIEEHAREYIERRGYSESEIQSEIQALEEFFQKKGNPSTKKLIDALRAEQRGEQPPPPPKRQQALRLNPVKCSVR